MDEPRYYRVAEILRILGTARRVQLLITMEDGEWTPLEIDNEIRWPSGTATRQLGYLKSCGLVGSSGPRYYSLTDEGLRVYEAVRSLVKAQEPVS